MKLSSLVFIMLLICGCKEKQVVKPPTENEQLPTANLPKQLSIKRIGELRFRKSYADHQYMTDKEYQKLLKSNPTYYYGAEPDSLLLNRFKALGYLNNNYELLPEKLESFELFNIEKPDTAFHLTDELNKKISCQIKKADSLYQYDLFAIDSSKRVVFKINNKFILPGLQLRTLDIITGGFEEVILLDAYYIINGDNFDFFIYEIKYI